jgi:23S rRNA (pseudouridine1915-N3)-methyltransferase
MRITVAAVGRWKRGPLPEMFDDYSRRLVWPLELKEVVARQPGSAAQVVAHEGELLLCAVPKDARAVALDARGRTLSSADFARSLQDWQADGLSDVAFLIGGADGLSQAVRERADLTLSLGPMTWPHQLVRVMLAEQLYRAQAILQNHPYHR